MPDGLINAPVEPQNPDDAIKEIKPTWRDQVGARMMEALGAKTNTPMGNVVGGLIGSTGLPGTRRGAAFADFTPAAPFFFGQEADIAAKNRDPFGLADAAIGILPMKVGGPIREATIDQVKNIEKYLFENWRNMPLDKKSIMTPVNFMYSAIKAGADSKNVQTFVKMGADGNPAAIGSLHIHEDALSGKKFAEIGYVGTTDEKAGNSVIMRLISHAQKLGFDSVYFLTQQPERYKKFGAQVLEERNNEWYWMRANIKPRAAKE